MTDTQNRTTVTYVHAERTDDSEGGVQQGKVLNDKYELIEPIGRGGMGVVWKAKDLHKDQFVALKFVPREVEPFEDEVHRLQNSFDKVKDIDHPGICPLYGMENGGKEIGYYLVMQYIEGITLNRWISTQAELSTEHMIRILEQIAVALDSALHQKRLIHRDIKPANIMLEGNNIEKVRLIDFGLVDEILTTLTRVSQMEFARSGTRPYMAPETWRGWQQSGATDQYALAVVAYELLAGHVPFQNSDVSVLREAVLKDSPDTIGTISPTANKVLQQALAKSRTERFKNCQEFISKLKEEIFPQPAGKRMVLSIEDIEYPFRWCPPGTFMMGSPTSGQNRSTDETPPQVTLSRGFWLLETPVTQGMWEGIMGNNPSNWKGVKLPVEQVSWGDCQGFIQKLNGLGVAPDGYRFSLPTEAQWEYACRAGTTTPFNFGSTLNGDKANCNGNYPYGTSTKGRYLEKSTEVGTYPANAWGLYDMHGNVWEWCSDWYGDYPSGAVTDPTGASTGSYRVLRGGSWSNSARHCRSAHRRSSVPSNRNDLIGIRLSLVRAE